MGSFQCVSKDEYILDSVFLTYCSYDMNIIFAAFQYETMKLVINEILDKVVEKTSNINTFENISVIALMTIMFSRIR